MVKLLSITKGAEFCRRLAPAGIANLIGGFIEAIDLDQVTLIGNDTGVRRDLRKFISAVSPLTGPGVSYSTRRLRS
jgi:hypothetical protein